MARAARGMVFALTASMLAGWGVGCSASNEPGDLAAVSPVSVLPRAGRVYLVRGWLGVFSTGMDTLRKDLEAAGVRAAVFQETQETELARRIGEAYAAVAPEAREPLVLVGHSYGADASIGIARSLAGRGIEVELIVTLDPVTPEPVPGNVVRVHNLYQSNGVLDRLPWWRGIPLTRDAASPPGATALRNMDLRSDRPDLNLKGLDHANIEDLPAVRADVLAEVLKACPPREAWAARSRPAATGAASRPATGGGHAGR